MSPGSAGQGVRVAVVGAGIAGLACAGALAEAGATVTVYEQTGVIGGRAATLRSGGHSFDHGAPFIGVTFGAFEQRLRALRASGVVVPWGARLAGNDEPGRTRLVAIPAMGALATALAAGLRIVTDARVERLARDGRGWSLAGPAGRELGRCDAVALAVPAPQARSLLAPCPELAERAARAELLPRWVGLLAFDRPVDVPWSLREPDRSVPALVIRDSDKPGRGNGERWVIQAGPEWSRERLEKKQETVVAELLELFAAATGATLDRPAFLAAHLWRYADAERVLVEPCLWDAAAALGACGDWCPGGRIPGAYASGVALARAIGASATR